MIKNREIGTVETQSGKMVILSHEEFSRLCDDHGLDVKTVLTEYDHVPLNFGYDSVFGVDAVKTLNKDGKVYSAATIGLQPCEFVRMLYEGEKSFQEFIVEQHKNEGTIVPGSAIWQKAAKDYHNYILGVRGEDRPNADLDLLFAAGA
jgi:hypothetical protein